MKMLRSTSNSIKNTPKISSLILLISLISTISCSSFCDHCQCYNDNKVSIDNYANETFCIVSCNGNQLVNKQAITTAYKMQTLEWPASETHKIIGNFNNLNLTVLPRFVYESFYKRDSLNVCQN